MQVQMRNLAAEEVGPIELADGVFGVEVRPDILHRVVVWQLAKRRAGTHKVKTRGEINRTGAKLYKQKGTGRARHGSIRSPIWVGGGVVFGPKPRNHSVRVNKKMRKAALRSALADKAGSGSVWVLDGFEEPRTKIAAACLRAADISGRVLIVLDPADDSSPIVDRAFRNLEGAAFSLVGSLSSYDVLVADDIVFTAGAFGRFTGERELR
jgi:large subunit ribosomal protein L4